MLLMAAVTCLALNVYHESRGEPISGQYAVALATMNRVKESGDNVCEVVAAPKQFSWTNGGKAVKAGKGMRISNDVRPKDERAWIVARLISESVLEGAIPDFTRGSTYYHVKTVHPAWRNSFERTIKVGSHVFYRNT